MRLPNTLVGDEEAVRTTKGVYEGMAALAHNPEYANPRIAYRGGSTQWDIDHEGWDLVVTQPNAFTDTHGTYDDQEAIKLHTTKDGKHGYFTIHPRTNDYVPSMLEVPYMPEDYVKVGDFLQEFGVESPAQLLVFLRGVVHKARSITSRRGATFFRKGGGVDTSVAIHEEVTQEVGKPTTLVQTLTIKDRDEPMVFETEVASTPQNSREPAALHVKYASGNGELTVRALKRVHDLGDAVVAYAQGYITGEWQNKGRNLHLSGRRRPSRDYLSGLAAGRAYRPY